MEARKTCLLVTNLFPPAIGGSSQVYAALAGHAGGEIAVLTSSHDYETGLVRGDWQAFDLVADYPVTRVRCVRPFSRKLYAGAGFRYRLHEAAIGLTLAATVIGLAWRLGVKAICIADDETVGWLALLSRHVLRRKTLIYCHGDDLASADARRMRWFRQADRIVAANRHAARLLTEQFAVPAEKIALIPNGVDLAAFHPDSPPGWFLRQYGLSGRKVLVTVTRLVPRKGVDKVLEALPAIMVRFPDVLYLIAGDGPQRAALEEMARQLGVASHVVFAGAVPHVGTVHFYNAAELVLLPNREEGGEVDGLPLVFLEANACAKPVIGGRAGGTSEVILDGENGVIVDGLDAKEIARVICELLGDVVRRQTMGQNGLRIARNWDWCAQTKLFIAACNGSDTQKSMKFRSST